MAGPFAAQEAREPDPGVAEPPGPGFFGSIGPGFNRARAAEDWGLNQMNYEGRVMLELEAEAKKRGFRSRAMAGAENVRSPYGSNYTLEQVDEARINELLGWYQAERQRDPKLLPQYAGLGDRKALREYALQRRRDDVAKADDQLQGGSTAGELVGALGAGFLDPTSYIPVGGQASRTYSIGRRILETALREGAANAGMTVALEPFVQQDAAALGVERGAAQFGIDVLASFGTGLGIGGTASALGAGLEGLARRRAAAGTTADRALLDAHAAAVPEENRTPAERAAHQTVERVAEDAESSPFEPTPDGDGSHAAGLEAAFRRAIETPREAPAVSVPRETIRRSEVAASPAPNVRAPAREQVKARIRGAESSGNDRAANPGSTASGRYQFTLGTWLSYYKRRYGGKEGNDAIWAKRFDPNLQEVLMNDLVGDNAAALRKAGQPETAGSLYLLHFAGEEGGLKILRAAPETPIERILSPEAVAKNKLHGKTAGDMVAWADRKMGQEAPTAPRTGGGEAEELVLPELPEIDRSTVPVDFAARADWLDEIDRPLLRAELFGTSEEHARAQVALWDEHDAAEGFARVIDDPPEPAPVVEVKDRRPAPGGGRQRSGPVHVLQAIADAGGIIDNEGHSLVEGMGVPRFRRDAGTIIRAEGHPRGRSIDGIGEYLWERGYFGPSETTPRPSVDEVLDLIERGIREKVYKPDEAADVRVRGAAPEEDDVRWELDAAAREHGLALDDATMDDALARRAHGVPAEDAVREAAEAAAFRDLDPAAELARFDDPDGEGIAAQIDSLEHDLRMELEGEPGEARPFADADLPPAIRDLSRADALAELERQRAYVARLAAQGRIVDEAAVRLSAALTEARVKWDAGRDIWVEKIRSAANENLDEADLAAIAEAFDRRLSEMDELARRRDASLDDAMADEVDVYLDDLASRKRGELIATYVKNNPPPGYATLRGFDDEDLGVAGFSAAELSRARDRLAKLESAMGQSRGSGDAEMYDIGDGEAVTLAELLGEIDDDAQAVDAMRGCMAPVAEAAE